MSILDQIRIAQRDAGEAAVIKNLEQLGLIPKTLTPLELITKQRDDLLQELRNIANADTAEWDDRSEFEAWAKNRARAAIAKATA